MFRLVVVWNDKGGVFECWSFGVCFYGINFERIGFVKVYRVLNFEVFGLNDLCDCLFRSNSRRFLRCYFDWLFMDIVLVAMFEWIVYLEVF